jgi:hypothetical protein
MIADILQFERGKEAPSRDSGGHPAATAEAMLPTPRMFQWATLETESKPE